jgi:hypothetical protein
MHAGPETQVSAQPASDREAPYQAGGTAVSANRTANPVVALRDLRHTGRMIVTAQPASAPKPHIGYVEDEEKKELRTC